MLGQAKHQESGPGERASKAVEKHVRQKQNGITEVRSMSDLSATLNTYPCQNERIWSKSERVIARRVFNGALNRELQEVVQKAKRMASQIKEPADVWELERYLTQCRKGIDRKYEFRSSQLVPVFGSLLYERRITEAELSGLQESKMKAIRSYAQILSESAA